VARIPLITERTDDLTAAQADTFDWVVRSRGKMIRPFEVLLHTPAIARLVAELGAQIRFESTLSDHDRELVILSAARAHDCAFEWDSHRPLAEAVGVRAEVIDHVRTGAPVELTGTEALLIGFVRELCASSTVSEETFAAARNHLGDAGIVELSATVGYYTLLGYVMGACDAC
jgi:4-carboxymuconolactone decarboxylase